MISKISLVIGSIGAFIIGISTIRWFFLYPDMSQFVIGGGIGVIFLGFGYIHLWMRAADERFVAYDKRLDAIQQWFIKEELK